MSSALLQLEQEASESNNTFARRIFNQLFHDGIKDRIERKMSGREDGEDGEESKAAKSSSASTAAMDTSPDDAAATSSSDSVWGANGPPKMIALDSVLVDGAADGVQKMDLNASGVAGSAQQQEVLSVSDTAKVRDREWEWDEQCVVSAIIAFVTFFYTWNSFSLLDFCMFFFLIFCR